MIDYPKLTEQKSSREMVDVFKGYNHNLRIGDGEFCDMENLSSDCYPVLSPRKKRGTMLDINSPSVTVYNREGLLTGVVCTDRWGPMYTQGPNLYFYGGNSYVPLGLNDEPKKFVFMGAYLIILPDMRYINLQNPYNDYGDINFSTEVSEGEVTFELCTVDGEVYEDTTVSDAAPEAPENGDYWIDTSSSPHTLKQYAAATDTWVAVATTYVKISGKGISSGAGSVGLDAFRQYDGVTISGITAAGATHLNGAAVVWGEERSNQLIVAGILDEVVTQDCSVDGAIRVERKAPTMDYVVEAGNRLWGCHYGDGINEIYASKLGDPRNWNCFMGISTDSWAASVGSQGDFTGAANIGGYPVFYKSDMKHKVWISDTGAHQITSTPCQGVAYGCEDSVATVDGVAIYKSNRGFCMDDGGTPVEIGQCFAGVRYTSAIGCASGRKYYVSMMDDEEKWHLFVYDTEKQLWHREDDFHAISFAGASTYLMAVSADAEKILDMSSGTDRGDKKTEDAVRWMAETGEIGLDSPDTKYISRLTLRLSMEVGAELSVYAQYDMEEEWVALGSIRGTSLRSFSLPIRPRRCDHLRLRFEGEGDVKLYSITKTIEEGSELS